MTPTLPPPDVEVVVVYPPRLPALGGEAAFSILRIEMVDTPRLDDHTAR